MIPLLKQGACFPRGLPPLYNGRTCRAKGSLLNSGNKWVEEKLIQSEIDRLMAIVADDLSHLTPEQIKMTQEVYLDFYKSVVDLCVTEFTPIDPEYDFGVEEWLSETTSYTEADKARILKEIDDYPDFKTTHDTKRAKRAMRCECHIKDEPYPSWKPARPIKSRSDRWKAHVGPAFNAINKVLFKHRFFIKKVPLPDRSNYMKKMFEEFKSILNCTDYSKFESHFIRMVMEMTEFVFYDFVLQHTKIRSKFMADIRKVHSLKQTFKYQKFMTSFKATRASGEMCTSSGNGFSNFAFFNYLSKFLGAEEVAAVFEGDDGVTAIKPADIVMKTQDYEDLGLLCKLNQTVEFCEASFCGIVCDPDDMVQVTDVNKALVNFGWTNKKYANADHPTRMSLLRAKGYSMIYQYPGCPILQSLALYALRVTNKLTIHTRMLAMYAKRRLFQDRYTHDKYHELFDSLQGKILTSLPTRLVPDKTRDLVNRLYGIAPESQIEFEHYLDSLTEVQQLTCSFDFPRQWHDAWDMYVRDYSDIWIPLSHPTRGPTIRLGALFGSEAISNPLREKLGPLTVRPDVGQIGLSKHDPKAM
jgi:hypothetical protein